jgi:hypothetical protein
MQAMDGQHGPCAWHAGYLSLQTHTLRICNTYCFYTAKMVAQTRLSLTLYAHCLSFLTINANSILQAVLSMLCVPT